MTLAVVGLALLSGRVAAQDGTRHMGEVRVTPWGRVLDFTPNGAWRVQARRVAEARALRLEAALRGIQPSAALTQGPAAVTGTRYVPAILFSFADSQTATAHDSSEYTGLLFGATGTAAHPYTIRTYYEEISHGLVSVQGHAIGWFQLPGTEVTYSGPYQGCTGDNPYGTQQCNGIWNATVFSAMQAGLRQALAKADSLGTDWGQFDNDGPDGIPNSGDDDGYVDMVIFVQSQMDGACVSSTNNHLWSHKSSLSFTTSTLAAGGGNIRVLNYTLQAGLGGSDGCTASQIMPVGTAAHETGHAFDLPDLYTYTHGEGIGHWGLMGSGNYRTPVTPAYMSAWSRNELGWVTPVVVDHDSTLTLSPVEQSDTVLVVPIAGSNEYFLLENRQPLGSDTAMHGPGLLVWHVDSVLIRSRGGVPDEGDPYALALMQADGANHLRSGTNRGDAGDPFPGGSSNARFSYNTVPSSDRNNGAHTWITLDSIAQVTPYGAVRFRLSFGVGSVVAASDTGPEILLDGVAYARFEGVLTPGSTHTLDMDSLQVVGGSRWTWLSWSDGQPRTHSFTASASGDTLIAAVRTEHRIQVTVSGQGTVVASTGDDLTGGVFYDAGTTVTLTPSPAAGQVFDHWQIGSVSDTTPVRMVTLNKPATLSAIFVPELSISLADLAPLVGTAFDQALTAAGGTGSYTWQRLTGALPAGVAFTPTGHFMGTPTELGAFPITVTVRSGRQSLSGSVTLSVAAPDLAVSDVVAALLGDVPLSAAQLAYVDLLGNQNGVFDLGDFLAWVEATGATPSAEAMAQVMAHAGGAR